MNRGTLSCVGASMTFFRLQSGHVGTRLSGKDCVNAFHVATKWPERSSVRPSAELHPQQIVDALESCRNPPTGTRETSGRARRMPVVKVVGPTVPRHSIVATPRAASRRSRESRAGPLLTRVRHAAMPQGPVTAVAMATTRTSVRLNAAVRLPEPETGYRSQF